MQSTKISGLAVDTEYVFHLLLRTTAGTYPSEKVAVRTHKMTDLSGITVTPGILPAQLRDSLMNAIERIGAKMADTVRIDTTHFVTTEGRGIAWEKAVEMNIPVVRPEWVEGCERGGRIVGVRQYYLDADPRQRQVFSQSERQLQEQPVRQQPQSPEKPNGMGANGHTESPPTPPPKDAREVGRKDEREGSEEEENELPVEQEGSVEDSEERKMAYRPAGASPNAEKGDAPVGLGLKDLPGESPRSGESTPGRATFQDVAL